MKTRKINQIICCILAVALLLSGMCFENIKADSMVDYGQNYPVNASFCAVDTYVSPSDGCTHEMLGQRSSAVSVIDARKGASCKTASASPILNYVENQPHNLCNILERVEREPHLEVFSNTTIMQFIHNQDGEKAL